MPGEPYVHNGTDDVVVRCEEGLGCADAPRSDPRAQTVLLRYRLLRQLLCLVVAVATRISVAGHVRHRLSVPRLRRERKRTEGVWVQRRRDARHRAGKCDPCHAPACTLIVGWTEGNKGGQGGYDD